MRFDRSTFMGMTTPENDQQIEPKNQRKMINTTNILQSYTPCLETSL